MSTKIQLTDDTWNPVSGCTRIAEGCRNCYAERLTATRLRQHPRYKGLAVMQPGGPRWSGEVRTHPEVLREPLRWRKPKKVFVCDMSDLFHESVPFDFVDQVFVVMALCPHITFQVLTKRPHIMALYFDHLDDEFDRRKRLSVAVGSLLDGPWIHADGKRYRPRIEQFINDLYAGEAHELGDREPVEIPWPLPNVWLGTSIATQKEADANIPHLLKCPAAVRFLSIEPLIEPVNLWLVTKRFRRSDNKFGCDHCCNGDRCDDPTHHDRRSCPFCRCTGSARIVDWVITGGESGPTGRPCNIAHLRSIVQQCQAAGVACFVKQLGRVPLCNDADRESHEDGTLFIEGIRRNEWIMKLGDPKGGDPAEWPEDLRVREFPKSAEGGAA